MGLEPEPPSLDAAHLKGQGPRLSLENPFGKFYEGLPIFRQDERINRFAPGPVERAHLDHVQSGAVHHDQGPVGGDKLHTFRLGFNDRLEKFSVLSESPLQLAAI